MSEHAFLIGALSIFGLLTLSTIIHSLCKRLQVPFAVGLLLSGMLVSSIVQIFDWQDHLVLSFSPEIVFYIFLPTLIFESAYHLNFRQFRGVLREVTTLATVGLIAAILLTAAGLHYVFDWPWVVSLLFGALIAATDPVAVLAVFRELKAPKKLSTIVDGESLVNDGTALVLFQFFLGLAVIGAGLSFSPMVIFAETLHLFSTLLLGLGFGIVAGVIFSIAIANASSKGVKLTLSLVLAHLTFLIAEGILGVSGILATMAAGLVMGNFGQRKLKPANRKSFSEIWQFLGFISNALIFLLLGIKLGEINFLQYWQFIGVAILLAVIVGRLVAVLSCFWLTNKTRDADRQIPLQDQVITFWGGIRGALSATAVLLIPESFAYAEVLQAMTAGVIIFTFLVNGTTIGWLLRKLKIVDFTGSEKLQRSEARLVINEEVCQYLDSLLKRKYISEKTHQTVKQKYLREHAICVKDFSNIQKHLSGNAREFTKILTHYALGIELKTYNHLFAVEEISEERYRVLQSSIYRQLERLERDILPEERVLAHKYAPDVPKDFWLSQILRRLRLQTLAKNCLDAYTDSRVLARLQHYRARRIASWKVIHDFKQLKKDHPIFTTSPAVDQIIKRYQKWNLSSERKMKSLGNKFPEIVTQNSILMAERICLEKEKKIEQEFLEKGFISEKIYADLDEAVGKKFQRYRRRTWFDILFNH